MNHFFKYCCALKHTFKQLTFTTKGKHRYSCSLPVHSYLCLFYAVDSFMELFIERTMTRVPAFSSGIFKALPNNSIKYQAAIQLLIVCFLSQPDCSSRELHPLSVRNLLGFFARYFSAKSNGILNSIKCIFLSTHIICIQQRKLRRINILF